MILSLITIWIAFCWLLRETDYLRIRLPYGKIPDKVKRESWEVIRNGLRIPEKQQPFWFKHPENMQPLCGLDWLENTMHVIPEVEIQLINHVHKYTIKSENVNALRDAFRVYRNPYLKVKLAR